MILTIEKPMVSGPIIATKVRWQGTHTGRYFGVEPTSRRVDVDGIVV